MDVLKYFNPGTSLGIVGTHIANSDGGYTFIPSLSKWIRTEDLHDTREEAEKASSAIFL